MAEQDFVVTTSGGEQFFTGLIAPDRVENVFLSYPPKQVLELDQIKFIYTHARREHGLDIYKRRKQQGRKSSCASYAATTGCEARRAFDRKSDIEFGPEYLYSLVNNGRDAGSQLKDNMLRLLDQGCCLRASVPYQVHNLNDLSMEQKRFAAQEAKDYRALDWAQFPQSNPDILWANMISSIANRDPVLLAVHCGDNFFSCGPDGRCRPDKGDGNHGVCGVELEGVETAKSIRDIKIWTVNSHGVRFGKNGCYLHTYDHSLQPGQIHLHAGCRSMRTGDHEEIACRA